jgi:hypothetical protein
MDHMMENMGKRMNEMMQMQASDNFGDNMGGSHFVKQTFVSSTKMGPDGRPI